LETRCVATILSARRRRARRRRSASRTWGGDRPSDREPLLRAASSLGRPGRRGVAASRCRGRAERRHASVARVVAQGG
jgi:hypothetical protein